MQNKRPIEGNKYVSHTIANTFLDTDTANCDSQIVLLSQFRLCVGEQSFFFHMRIKPLSEDINAEGLRYEDRRRRNLIALLGVLQRRQIEPSNAEWSIIQKGLDDMTYRTADTMAILFMSVAFPLRHKIATNAGGSRFRFPKSIIPIIGALYGYEAGLHSMPNFGASEAWRALVMMDSKVGEVARVIYAPPDPDTVPPCQLNIRRPLLLSFLDFALLRNFYRSVFEGSSFMDRHQGITNYLYINISTRFLTWRPLHIYKRMDANERTLGFQINFLPTFSPRDFNQTRALTRVQRYIDLNTGGFAWYWYMFHLGAWRLSTK